MSLRNTLGVTTLGILIATLVYAQDDARPKTSPSADPVFEKLNQVLEEDVEAATQAKGVATVRDMLKRIAAKKPNEITDEQLRFAVIEMANRVIALEAANQPRLQPLGPN